MQCYRKPYYKSISTWSSITINTIIIYSAKNMKQ